MEVLGFCFDVEPLPNDGLGPGQLFPTPIRTKARSETRHRKIVKMVHVDVWSLTLFLVGVSSLIVSMLPHAAPGMGWDGSSLQSPPNFAPFSSAPTKNSLS